MILSIFDDLLFVLIWLTGIIKFDLFIVDEIAKEI